MSLTSMLFVINYAPPTLVARLSEAQAVVSKNKSMPCMLYAPFHHPPCLPFLRMEPVPSSVPSSPTLSLAPALPLRTLLLVAARELCIIVIVLLLPYIHKHVLRTRFLSRSYVRGAHEIPGVQLGVLVLLYEVLEAGVGGVDELDGGQARLVAHARAAAGLEHHAHEGVAEVALRRRLAVDPPDGAVQRGVALDPVQRVAFEVGGVEEGVDYFVCGCVSMCPCVYV